MGGNELRRSRPSQTKAIERENKTAAKGWVSGQQSWWPAGALWRKRGRPHGLRNCREHGVRKRLAFERDDPRAEGGDRSSGDGADRGPSPGIDLRRPKASAEGDPPKLTPPREEAHSNTSETQIAGVRGQWSPSWGLTWQLTPGGKEPPRTRRTALPRAMTWRPRSRCSRSCAGRASGCDRNWRGWRRSGKPGSVAGGRQHDVSGLIGRGRRRPQGLTMGTVCTGICW